MTTFVANNKIKMSILFLNIFIFLKHDLQCESMAAKILKTRIHKWFC